MTGMSKVELLARAREYGERKAIIASEGVFTYAALLKASGGVAADLLQGEHDLDGAHVGVLAPPGFRYVASLWGVWRAGGAVVPLAVNHPRPELEYVIGDSEVSVLVTTEELADKLRPIAVARGLPLIIVDLSPSPHEAQLPEIDSQRRALIVYTSGTTGKPKGVVLTHGQIQAQIAALASAWGWSSDDHILHILPLHHTHGIIVILLSALFNGAICEILPGFDAEVVWQRMVDGDLTLFMAVPTVYTRLERAWESSSSARQEEISVGAANLRLMVSGSAALPVRVLEKWKSITGHVLLERYGMTEIGIALSNPLEGERLAGTVGRPVPGMEVRVVDEKDVLVPEGVQGELQVKSPGVFREYWHRPEVTAESFVDGWFKTGDIVVREKGVFRIMGRSSVDIIKTGGYKVSALEIEEVLREHPAVADCAVVGIPDEEWGQRVAAAAVLRPGGEMDLQGMRVWAKEILAPYKVPSRLLLLNELPRNPMGKVTKKKVVTMFDG